MTALRKAALVVLVAGSTTVGLWALAAPRSFYDDFPGAGRAWVAVDGPFNEHLVRDVGALNLALAFVAVVALVTGSVLVARVAGGAQLVYGVPHLVYHALHLDGFDTTDQVALVASLAFTAAAALAAAAPTSTKSRSTGPDCGPTDRDFEDGVGVRGERPAN